MSENIRKIVKGLPGLWAEDVIKQTVNGNIFMHKKPLPAIWQTEVFLYFFFIYNILYP